MWNFLMLCVLWYHARCLHPLGGTNKQYDPTTKVVLLSLSPTEMRMVTMIWKLCSSDYLAKNIGIWTRMMLYLLLVLLIIRGRPKWILLADPMADVSVTTSADVRSDVFRYYCNLYAMGAVCLRLIAISGYGFMFFGM